MKIGVTTYGCDHGRSGIGRYLERHLREFERLGVEPTIYSSEQDRPLLGSLTPKNETGLVWDKPIPNILLHQTWLPSQAKDVDVLFLPAANRRIPWRTSCPTVGTVHDLAVARLKEKYDPCRHFYVSQVLPRFIRRLDHIITVSEYSKRDIVELTGCRPERVSVIPLGVDHSRYFPHTEGVDLSSYGIYKPFFLYVSRIEHPGKNHQLLLKTFDRLKQRLGLPHQLVLVGSDWKGAEEVHRLADSLPSRPDILFTGFFPEEHLPHLYSQGEALIFPSLYEGFGLPVLEAMACGLPVVCSNKASLPEVVGEGGLLFDPDQPGDLEATLERLISSRGLKEMLRESGRTRSLQFQWSATAAQTYEVLSETAQKHKLERNR